MVTTLDSVVHDALALPPDERLAVARRILESVEPGQEPGAEAAWEAEITERLALFRAGESAPVAAGDVFARLRQIAPDR